MKAAANADSQLLLVDNCDHTYNVFSGDFTALYQTVDATAALLIDLDTDQVLYEQAADEQRYPASITKIMTALLTLEAIGRGELDLNTEITVDAAALADITEDSSTANLQAGEKITVKNLLYCLLLALRQSRPA